MGIDQANHYSLRDANLAIYFLAKYFFRGMVVGHEKVDWPDAGTFVYDSLCNKVFRYMAGW